MIIGGLLYWVMGLDEYLYDGLSWLLSYLKVGVAGLNLIVSALLRLGFIWGESPFAEAV